MNKWFSGTLLKHCTVKCICVGWRSNLKQSETGVGKHRDNMQEGKQPEKLGTKGEKNLSHFVNLL